MGTALGRELGLDQDTIDGIADWRATDKLTTEEKLVVEYAEALSVTPPSVDDDLRSRIAAHFTPKQAVELTNLIAWENARARFNRGFDVQPDGYTI